MAFFYDQPLFGLLCLKVIGNPFRFLQAVVHFLPKKSPFFDPFNRIVLSSVPASDMWFTSTLYLYISIFLIYLNINLRII